MVRVFQQIFLVAVSGALFFTPLQAEDLAERVVILVNARDPDSIRIGEHYAAKRNIPSENILRLDAPVSETISRAEFVEQIHNPLQEKLLAAGWLDGFPTKLTDSEGRYRSLLDGHRISYLVVCRGIPLRIAHDEARVTEQMRQAVQKEFAVNSAAVDSELALMTGLLPTIAFIGNPLFGNKNPSAVDLNRVIKVARLDGPTAADAMALVDRAILAEEQGLRGRAYIDLAGPHADGTDWLAATGDRIEALGFDLVRHEERGTFPVTARFDAPALYFGWYANDLRGPFAIDGFRFPPGAIALHIHSFSARTLRSTTAGWTGPLVARGVTVTFGNVYEPYLAFSHRPDLFFEWIADGGTVGDAAAYSIRALSWQGVFIGDPLYRPFARSLEEQLAESRENGADELAAYAGSRSLNLALQNGSLDEAIEAGEKRLKEMPSLVMALKVARLKSDGGDRSGARRILRDAEKNVRSFAPSELMLGKALGDFLSELGDQDRALKVYRQLLKGENLPRELRIALIEDGLLLAERQSERRLARDWRTELSRLRVPTD